MKVLLSIKPQYAEKILRGTKRYEYRRRIFSEIVDTVLVYATMPEGKIVGHFQLRAILHDSVDSLWVRTKAQSGVTHDVFCQYFSGLREGYALEVLRPTRYDPPIDPRQVLNTFHAPQSFQYVDGTPVESLLRLQT